MFKLNNRLIKLFCALLALKAIGAGPFSWMKKDSFDEINDKMTSVTQVNCRLKSRSELELPKKAVSHVPIYTKLLNTKFFSNRSMLMHMHNMALNRAFFYSFIYQRVNKSGDFQHQPGLMYLYMSAAADVSASPGFINGSSLLFDYNCTYPNWYTTSSTRQTLDLFGLRAWRADDYNEPTNWLREPTNRTIEVHDCGVGRDENYTAETYKYAPYTRYEYDPTEMGGKKPLFWWPDNKEFKDSLRKYVYRVGIRFSNVTGQFIHKDFTSFRFYGPPQPTQSDLNLTIPVLLTQPYFDCGRSNSWITTMTAPVVDFARRYSPRIHLKRPRFVAVIGMDGEFERIDINQCPISEGNEKPNMFAGTHRCRPTTMCEPISGYGFRRGGYQCVCLPGYYYPWWHDGPFQDWEIEQATQTEYEDGGFDCLKGENMLVNPLQISLSVNRSKYSTDIASRKDEFLALASPQVGQSASPNLRQMANRNSRDVEDNEQGSGLKIQRKFIKRYDTETVHVRKKRDALKIDSWTRMLEIRKRFFDIKKDTCKNYEPTDRHLPGDAAYGVEKQFEPQGRTALRLAHFLSNFQQNVDEYEQFGYYVKGDRRLNETHIFGEVLAMVMGDFKILSAGVYFDQYKFRVAPPVKTTDPGYSNTLTREYFGPLAWRIQNPKDRQDEYRAVDSAGFKTGYDKNTWFHHMKQRWISNFHGLKKYINKPMIRPSPFSNISVRFGHYPITYKAPSYEDGQWMRPEFKCDPTDDGMVNDWVSTYVVPFFGLNSVKTQVEFNGVVTVDVDFKDLDINQCPSDSYVANAFKNTAKCDFKSQYCVPMPSKGFEQGAYKCECRQGYEYPFDDTSWFFHGQMMEEEYDKKLEGLPNRYDTLKCRRAGATSVVVSWTLMVVSLVTLLLWKH